MEQTLRELFAYQRFENNPRLSVMISDTLKRYDFFAEGELSDDSLEFLNAAGSTVADPKLDKESSSWK